MNPEITNLTGSELSSRFDPAARIPEYLALLRKENDRLNLVSRETSDDQLTSLALESIAPLAFLEESNFASYLDIGSGGGFPAFPLLLSGRIQQHQPPVLVERVQKKAAALRRIATALGLKAETIARNLSEIKLSTKFDLITLRFVKLTPELLRIILPLLSPRGRFVYFSDNACRYDKKRYSRRIFTYTIDSREPVRTLSVYSRNKS